MYRISNKATGIAFRSYMKRGLLHFVVRRKMFVVYRDSAKAIAIALRSYKRDLLAFGLLE